MKRYLLFLLLVFLLLIIGGNFRKIISFNKVNTNQDDQDNISTFGDIKHLGWVVKDIYKTAEYWEKIGLPKVKIRENVHLERGLYRGKKMDAYVHSGWTELEGIGIEFFQPLKGESAFSEYFKKHGEGIHHVAFEMNSHEELEKQITRWKNIGIGVQAEGAWDTEFGKARFVYMDTEPVGGLTFEFGYFPRGKKEEEKSSFNPKFPYGKIFLLAVAARDVVKVSDFYKKLGFEFRFINKSDAGLLRRYKGEKKETGYHVAWFWLGTMNFEIVQPVNAWNVYNDFFEKHGEGMPHLGFDVKDMDKAIEYAKQLGIEVVMDGAWGEPDNIKGRFAYLNTEPVGGIYIELLWHNR